MPRCNYHNYRNITLLSRDLRKNLTSSERKLWEILRYKKLFGFKFLRQHPVFYRIDKDFVEFFIADFYCARLRLIIEIDGPVHENHKEYDAIRDLKLASKGIMVLRIKNEELVNITDVISRIEKVISNLSKSRSI